jgi:hypothetical protein
MVFQLLSVLVIAAPIRIAAIGINFSDAKLPISKDDIEQVYFNSEVSAKKYFKETSYGKMELEGDVHIVDIDKGIGDSCDAALWRDSALEALQAQEVDTLKYDNFSFIVPPAKGCVWVGLGEQPGRYTWMHLANRLDVGFLSGVVAHELGHNINMQHACSTTCKKDGKIVPFSDDCELHVYGNRYDIMGIVSEMPHQSATNKMAVDWILDEDIGWVIKDGEYRLVPLEMTKGVRALVMRRPAGDFIVLELRSQMGFDSKIEKPGILAYLSIPGDPTCRGRLLDMHPNKSEFFNEALFLDESFTDPLSNVKMTIKELSYQHAVVAFEGIIPVESANPSVNDLGFYEATGCSFSSTNNSGLFIILLVGLLIWRETR